MIGWQWHQLDHMHIICTSLQTDNHASTSSLNFLLAGGSSWCQSNSVKALKAKFNLKTVFHILPWARFRLKLLIDLVAHWCLKNAPIELRSNVYASFVYYLLNNVYMCTFPRCCAHSLMLTVTDIGLLMAIFQVKLGWPAELWSHKRRLVRNLYTVAIPFPKPISSNHWLHCSFSASTDR